MVRLRCHSLPADIDMWAFRSLGVNDSSSCCGVRLMKPKLSSAMALRLLWLPYEKSSTLLRNSFMKFYYDTNYSLHNHCYSQCWGSCYRSQDCWWLQHQFRQECRTWHCHLCISQVFSTQSSNPNSRSLID